MKVALSIALALVLLAGSSPRAADDASKSTEEWRAKRATELQGPDNWLTVAGLFFLKPGANSIGTHPDSDIVLPAGSAPEHSGQVTYQNGKVWLELRPGVDATAGDKPIAGRYQIASRTPAGAPAPRVASGRIGLQLHQSGERTGIRLRDPESALRRQFAGLRWYPVDAAYRITGKLIRYDQPKQIVGQNILGDVTTSTSPGEIEFRVNGQVVRLIATTAGKGLSFVFRDATAGTDTYRIRFLSADAPAANGDVVLDFNRAYNPPCAFNPHTTCPIPPPQNRLTIPIAAGEKLYLASASTTTSR